MTNPSPMNELKRKASETAAFLRARIGAPPETGLLTGTGLGEAAAALQVSAAFDYKDIPHFPIATVPSHAGRLVFGTIHGRPVMVMQGRFHHHQRQRPRPPGSGDTGGNHRLMWCTDDRHPHDLVTEGHIDSIVREAIRTRS